jgi:hypothetical protein
MTDVLARTRLRISADVEFGRLGGASLWQGGGLRDAGVEGVARNAA